MSDDIFEYYFLSDCYSKNVDDSLVYMAFIEKVITDYGRKINTTVSRLQHYLLTKYSLDIPPTLIRDIIRSLSREYPGEIIFDKEKIKIEEIPKELEKKATEKQAKSDDDSREVFSSFNSYLEENNSLPITFKEFIEQLKEYKKRLFRSEYVIPANETEKLFMEWVSYIFNVSRATKIADALNKIMYSWLIYYYFHAIKRASKKLNQFHIHLDTNILAYYFGINGEERKNYVMYLLQKVKENNCKVIVSSVTLKEFHDLIKASPNNEIRLFISSVQNNLK